MIEFKNKVNEQLPYNRKKYTSRKGWFGFSFQLPGVFEGKDIGLDKYVEVYDDLFKYIICLFKKDSRWIVNHDFLDEEWFPNNQNNLKSLRRLFKQNNISNIFKGAIIFETDDILDYSKDLLSYPYSVINKKDILYNNIDISNSEFPFVIKISGHLTIDILSENKELLIKIVNENYSNCFILKEYK